VPRPLTAGTGLALAAWCGPGAAAHCRPLAGLLGVPRRRPGVAGIALTFDDGPHPQGTPAVLAALAGAQATATFFLVGEQVERYPALVTEIVAAGHEAAVHGYRHRCQMRLAPRAFAADLERAVAVISEVCRRRPACYRPPYGVFTLSGLRRVRKASLQPILWSQWARDWRADTSPREIAATATRTLTGGDVVLLHDADWYSSARSHLRTAAALPAILAAAGDRGLETIALSG
jgi:peptidoglycan/xylan/chitin deacetylase (PgdA/CDA1 family)